MLHCKTYPGTSLCNLYTHREIWRYTHGQIKENMVQCACYVNVYACLLAVVASPWIVFTNILLTACHKRKKTGLQHKLAVTTTKTSVDIFYCIESQYIRIDWNKKKKYIYMSSCDMSCTTNYVYNLLYFRIYYIKSFHVIWSGIWV